MPCLCFLSVSEKLICLIVKVKKKINIHSLGVVFTICGQISFLWLWRLKTIPLRCLLLMIPSVHPQFWQQSFLWALCSVSCSLNQSASSVSNRPSGKISAGWLALLVWVKGPADVCVSLCGNVIFIYWKDSLQREMHTELPHWSPAKLRQPYPPPTGAIFSHSLRLYARHETDCPPPTPSHTCTYTYTQGSFRCQAFCHGGEVRQHVILQHCVEYMQGPDSLAEWQAAPATHH